MTDQAFQFEHVCKRYPYFSLEDVSVSLEQGQIMGFVGPNGAGKSTTIRILMSLVVQDSGAVRVLGHEMPRAQALAKRDIGFVSDDMNLYGKASLKWHMAFVESIYSGWDADYAGVLLERFNLHAEQKISGLSHGERVKALLLMALARRPKLLALLGPNGAGKTTAISLSLGLLEADAGEVKLMGGSPHEVESRLEVGMMLQDVNLAPALRPRQLIELVSSYYPAPLPLEDVIGLSGIEPFVDKPYGKLSGGQKRRVQFAAAICGNPKLLFLDEPTVGLDIEARRSMWQSIRALIDRGCSIVLTTHYLEEAEALADRVAVLAQGRLIALGSVEEMRVLVSRKQIRCASHVTAAAVRAWPGVVDVVARRTGRRLPCALARIDSILRNRLLYWRICFKLGSARLGQSHFSADDVAVRNHDSVAGLSAAVGDPVAGLPPRAVSDWHGWDRNVCLRAAVDQRCRVGWDDGAAGWAGNEAAGTRRLIGAQRSLPESYVKLTRLSVNEICSANGLIP